MIKIKRNGHKIYADNCYSCNCYFTYENEDIKEHKVKCPFCGFENSHSSSNGLDVPDEVDED